MERKYQLDQKEMDELTVLIEEIDVIHGQLINHGLPDDEFIKTKISSIGIINSKIGKILDVWEDEVKSK